MRQLKPKQCARCKSIYIPTGSCSKYCDTCREHNRKAYQRRYQMQWRKDQGRPNVGVGRGGANKQYKEHPQYKTGMGRFSKLKQQMYQGISHCERCGKDLTNAGLFERCIHHKDHNRSNNERENLEMLCKRCHQLEHDCISNLRK